MRFLIVSLLAITVMGCEQQSVPAPAVHPFAATERLIEKSSADTLRKLDESAAVSAEVLQATTAQTERLESLATTLTEQGTANDKRLSQLLDQMQLLAGVMERQGPRDQGPSEQVARGQGARGQGPRDQALSPQPSALSPQPSALSPLQPSEIALHIPDGFAVVYNGQQVWMRDFVQEWYRRDWAPLSGTVEQGLLAFGVRPDHLAELSDRGRVLLFSAMHEHQAGQNGKGQGMEGQVGKGQGVKGQGPSDLPSPLNPQPSTITPQRSIIIDRQRIIQKNTPAPSVAGNCPGGVCPVQPQRSFSWSISRRRRR